MGTDVLFENHSVKEIQEIEKKLRNDIERKKEELRQMVGERYRDLMEAADTITEMKEIAESVTSCVRSIEDSCSRLQSSSLQHGILNSIQTDVLKRKKTNELLYRVSSQIKILMDAPTKIWYSIENNDFVQAVSLFLLSRHTHSLLSIDPVYRTSRVTSLFPIIDRQWTSISHFRHVLLENCHSILKTQDTEPEDALGPLCCSCLLSNTSVHQTFLEVLDTRMNVLQSIFRPEKSAKVQLCEFVTVVQMTLKMIYTLFHPCDQISTDQRTNNLHHTLKSLTSKEGPGPVALLDIKSSTTYKYLPSEVTDFRPILKASLDPCSEELLQSKVNEWLYNVKLKSEADLKNLLNFVTSVQSLSLIREALCDKLSEVKEWDKICMDLLKRPFSVWDTYLKECFWQRINDIINEQVKASSEYCQRDVEESLYNIGLDNKNSTLEIEKNVAVYVWAESPEDVKDGIAWLPRHHRGYWNSGELSMKAMGFTPKIQSMCRDMEHRLQAVLQDISHFSFMRRESQEKPDSVAAHLSQDANRIYEFLSEAVEKHLFDLSSYLETTLLCVENEKDSYQNNCRIVFLGHLCCGIANLCPQINICLSSDKMNECVERCLRLDSDITFSASVFKENELWKDLKKKLLHLSATAFRQWSKSQIHQVLNSIDAELVTSSPEDMLRSLLQWDKVEIQEESEQGNAVNSVLRVPQYVSTPVSNALFAFCCKLNAVGGFSISSEVRSEMSSHLLTGLLDIYKKKLNSVQQVLSVSPRLLQVQCLQLMFDVQYVSKLLQDKSRDDLGLTSQEIVTKASAHVDPFDLDVFSSPLQQNIKRALQKSLSLFGLLVSQEQSSLLNSSRAGTMGSSHMDPSTMLGCVPGGRFALLPLSSRITASQGDFLPSSVPAQDSEPNMLASHRNSSPNLLGATQPDSGANTLKSATSFYDRVTTAMSTSWFGN
ncbi:hypothetical protein JTE90_012766 [Oedothorax gibbosus]|uniref:Conserved oligomeric Golgi complex subunit 1 n=1 Tax=Oedothorax gibbosus TaxID=931172 RepID=A0AAV6VXF9_9ARAC|nr:hypothetical protein JTE90_012766 [Oedothorax gibbosus]